MNALSLDKIFFRLASVFSTFIKSLTLLKSEAAFTLNTSSASRRLAATMSCNICTERCFTVPATSRAARPRNWAVFFAASGKLTMQVLY